jgi:N-glycosylase/DNA lyase
LRSDEEVLPGVRWGRPDEVFTPAYWADLASRSSKADGFSRVRSQLRREVFFCLLGGFGVKAEVNKAAFNRLAKAGIFKPGRYPSSEEIEPLLRQPLNISGRRLRYRFPRQRAQRIAVAAQYVDSGSPPENDAHELRAWLLRIPGIGMKTASWIVRNHLGSDAVAILDVHIVRVCQMMNLFDGDLRLPKDYERLERLFLEFAKAIEVPSSLLDAIMWREVRAVGPLLARWTRMGRSLSEPMTPSKALGHLHILARHIDSERVDAILSGRAE